MVKTPARSYQHNSFDDDLDQRVVYQSPGTMTEDEATDQTPSIVEIVRTAIKRFANDRRDPSSSTQMGNGHGLGMIERLVDNVNAGGDAVIAATRNLQDIVFSPVGDDDGVGNDSEGAGCLLANGEGDGGDVRGEKDYNQKKQGWADIVFELKLWMRALQGGPEMEELYLQGEGSSSASASTTDSRRTELIQLRDGTQSRSSRHDSTLARGADSVIDSAAKEVLAATLSNFGTSEKIEILSKVLEGMDQGSRLALFENTKPSSGRFN